MEMIPEPEPMSQEEREAWAIQETEVYTWMKQHNIWIQDNKLDNPILQQEYYNKFK